MTCKQIKDDQKEKHAIYKFFDFTKGGANIVHQIDDYCTTRAKTLS